MYSISWKSICGAAVKTLGVENAVSCGTIATHSVLENAKQPYTF